MHGQIDFCVGVGYEDGAVINRGVAIFSSGLIQDNIIAVDSGQIEICNLCAGFHNTVGAFFQISKGVSIVNESRVRDGFTHIGPVIAFHLLQLESSGCGSCCACGALDYDDRTQGLLCNNIRNRNLVGFVLAVFVLEPQICVTVCRVVLVVFKAFFINININFIAEPIVVRAEHCAILNIPGQLVDVAGGIANNVCTARFILRRINLLHNNGNFLISRTVLIDQPSLSSSPNDFTIGVINDLQGTCI